MLGVPEKRPAHREVARREARRGQQTPVEDVLERVPEALDARDGSGSTDGAEVVLDAERAHGVRKTPAVNFAP